MTKKLRTVNLISGGGSTNLAILKAQKPGGMLHGLVETVAIISSNQNAGGIRLALEAKFPKEDIWTVSSAKGDLGPQILAILEEYMPNFFHQVGWMPWTPNEITDHFRGLNQHLGPGGKYMHGERRIFAHIRFCQYVREMRPIPIFCQLVHSKYDMGDAIFARFEKFAFTQSFEHIANLLLPIEHEVQIEALRLLATDTAKPFPVPRVYDPSKPEEERLMKRARLEAEAYYCEKENKQVAPDVLAELAELESDLIT